MYRIYYNDSLFILTDKAGLAGEADLVYRCGNPEDTRRFVLGLMEDGSPFRAVLVAEDLEGLLETFRSCFVCVQAAGGAVRRNGRILAIRRLGMEDLPKGHREAGESIEECAVREVEEECGISGVAITGHLTDTLHIYRRNGSWYLKKTSWYSMRCPAGQQPVPQTEEDIEKVYWIRTSQLDEVMSRTYPSLVPVFRMLQE